MASQIPKTDTSVQFSFSECFDKPPPHLGLGDSCGYTITANGYGTSVSDTPHQSSDRYRRSDYNAVIPFATRVVGGSRQEDQRIFRAYTTLFGDERPEETGSLPKVPNLQQFFTEVHDHMARRTVNNPDVLNRLENFELAKNAADLDTKGYTILEGAFTSRYADALREATEANHNGVLRTKGFDQPCF